MGQLCLISCNIRFDNPSDGVNAWPSRRTILCSTLMDHFPDLLATQEGRFNQLKDFETLLGDYSMITGHRGWIDERMYPTFFLKNNTFDILASGDQWLSETPEVAGSFSFGSAFPRLMTWIKIKPKNSAEKFLVINTHLDHIHSETRQEQIKVLIHEIKKIWQTDMKLIVMGDFNESPTSLVRDYLTSAFPNLQDAWKIFHSQEETSHHAFNGECQNGARIDWIMVDDKIKIHNAFMNKKASDGLYPSDHFPIICQINF